ncbi:PREDICTED: uncharacterized protein LOC104743994 [Camelina sativa]|uniref:Uncharacterized protein LOC104743994 n=1 Tax=Camelina sativa TaxID=90675 RepID=A0ABM0VYY9_CAMSA|nr:PREDICTED: uncharacterized protein LOC104743994 [Camelina sativa]
MFDAGVRDRPSGDPPDGQKAWVRTLTGRNSMGMSHPEDVLNDAFVKERVSLAFPNGEDGEPVITIGNEVLEAMYGLQKNYMILKVLGLHVSVSVLTKRLKEMWKPVGAMSVLDLPRQYFMIRFDVEAEYMVALTGGPWRMFGSYLLTQAWSPNFDPLRDEITTTPVWIRLSNLPVHFYHRSILMAIAEGLGNPIKVDLTTLNFERARFARVCVEVNLKKPLKETVMVNGDRYFVSYEGLSAICSRCGIYGHLVHNCPHTIRDRELVAASSPVIPASSGEAPIDDGFTVNTGGNRDRQSWEIPISKVFENIAISNRFGGLGIYTVSVGDKEVGQGREEDKENAMIHGSSRKGKKFAQGTERMFGGSLENQKDGFKGAFQEKRAEPVKTGANNGPKLIGPKSRFKPTKPSCGLIFGPHQDLLTLLESGKRLRTELGQVGQSRGAFVTEQTTGLVSEKGVTSGGDEVAISNPDTAEFSADREDGMQIVPPAEEAVGGDRAHRICQNLGFENVFRVDAVGQSGGLWLLWRSGIGVVTVVNSSDQYIHARIVDGLEVVHLIAVYAAPTVSRRSGLWGQLKDVIQGITEPIISGGDFNTIVRADERTGGDGQFSQDSLSFSEWINELALIDMGFKGNRFTWKRGRVESTFVAKRLDRILCCPQSRLKWQEASVTHLPFLSSDHAPLYIQLCPEVRSDPSRRPFRFETAWLSHPGFKELLQNSWNSDVSTPQALNGLRVHLKRWNKEVFGNVQQRKDKLVAEIQAVQDLLDVHQTDVLLDQEEVLLKEFEVVLEQEELIWFQKSREKWFVLGDRNTSYFQTSTVIRRRRNQVEMLRDDTRTWISDSKELEVLAVNYYK